MAEVTLACLYCFRHSTNSSSSCDHNDSIANSRFLHILPKVVPTSPARSKEQLQGRHLAGHRRYDGTGTSDSSSHASGRFHAVTPPNLEHYVAHRIPRSCRTVRRSRQRRLHCLSEWANEPATFNANNDRVETTFRCNFTGKIRLHPALSHAILGTKAERQHQ